MGITYVEGRVTGPTGRSERIRFLVDSGAQYSLLPSDVCRRIGLVEQRKQRFTLGDGRTIERGVSECHVALPQGDAHTPVILGEPDDMALLGMVTLEILGVVLDPFRRTIEPMHAPLTRAA